MEIIMLKRRVCIVIAFGVFGTAFSAYAAQDLPSIFPTEERISAASQLRDWGGLRPACEKDLTMRAYPLGDYTPAPHYDAKGESSKIMPSQTALSDESHAIYRLGLCYQISHDRKYAVKAEGLLDSWATTLTRIGNEQGGVDFNVHAPQALMVAYALKRDPAWDSSNFSTMVREKFVPIVKVTPRNNHANWGVLFQLTAGAFLGDTKLVSSSRDRWLDLMRSEVAEDGSFPQEVCRSNTTDWCGGPTKGIKGMHYEHFALIPLVLTAEIFKNMDMDVYGTPEGAILQNAYRKASAWTLHPETFPYYATNNGHLDNLYEAGYFYILQTVDPEPDGAAVINKFGAVLEDPLYLRAFYDIAPSHNQAKKKRAS